MLKIMTLHYLVFFAPNTSVYLKYTNRYYLKNPRGGVYSISKTRLLTIVRQPSLFIARTKLAKRMLGIHG